MKSVIIIMILSIGLCFSAYGQKGKSIPAASLAGYERDLKRIYPTYSRVEYERDYVFSIHDADGKTLGTLYLETIPDGEREFGYAGTIEVGLIVGPDRKVAGLVTGKNAETPGYLNRVKRALDQSWNGLELKNVPEHKVDAVTRATYSSSAIIVGVKKLAQAHAKSDTPLVVAKPQPVHKRANPELEKLNADIEKQVAEYRQAPNEKNKAALKALLLKQQGIDIDTLTRRVNMLNRIVTNSKILQVQWTTRRAEELDLRMVAALQGKAAAQEFAKEKGMVYFSHSRHGDKAEDKELAEAVKKCCENPGQPNEKALRTLVEERFELQLAGLPSHNENQERSYIANKARLEKMVKNKESDLERRLNSLIQ